MTPSETTPEPPGTQPPTRWGWPVWERDEVLREQVALLRQNFPMTLLASLATALGTLWVMARVADTQATTVWLSTHALVIAGVYLTLRSISPFTDPAPQAARKLIACMAAMGLSWGSLGYVVLYWGTPESVIYAIGIISTVSSGALGLGAPLYRAYVTYLTCAIGGVMMAVALAGGPVMWPALFLTGVYYALTGMQARTADRATRRSIALKLENDRLVNQLRAESQRALAAQEAAEKADRRTQLAAVMEEAVKWFRLQLKTSAAAEARAYLQHPVLGARLRQCVRALLDVNGPSAEAIFGYPDVMKLKSSMTLFAAVADAGLAAGQVSNPRTGCVMGVGGGSSADIVEANELLRTQGVRKVGPYRVPRTMTSPDSPAWWCPACKKAIWTSLVPVCLCLAAGRAPPTAAMTWRP